MVTYESGRSLTHLKKPQFLMKHEEKTNFVEYFTTIEISTVIKNFEIRTPNDFHKFCSLFHANLTVINEITRFPS